MNDPTAARMGLPAVPLETVAGDGPKRAPIVLLHHQPTVFEKAAALGVDLMLSGHTHHGQLWPLAQISRLFYSFQNGSYRIGAGQLWVTSGAGTWGPPMRLGAPPEIVRVRLRTAAGP
jgi:predicted MPP superfamily phosphohydrolase